MAALAPSALCTSNCFPLSAMSRVLCSSDVTVERKMLLAGLLLLVGVLRPKGSRLFMTCQRSDWKGR